MKRNVFFISDGTGITAEAIGQSLMTQFDNIEFNTKTLPYVKTLEEAEQAIIKINECFDEEGEKPLVFTTLLDPQIRHRIADCNGFVLDLFQAFLEPIESTLGVKSSYTVGKSHSAQNPEIYKARIDAINFALANDDGNGTQHYDKADVIIVGVSRSGKTPTCLYLAIQFGILAANYPMTEEDIHRHSLPTALKKHKSKLFGLTIDVQRLREIRSERRNNSRYASLEQCRLEVNEIETLLKQENIPYLNTTSFSIEEIATKLLAITDIPRRIL